MWQLVVVCISLLQVVVGDFGNPLGCHKDRKFKLQFHLVRECQRGPVNEIIAWENVSDLDECIQLAQDLRGLALNYAPGSKYRRINRFAKHYNYNASTYRNHKAERERLGVFEQPAEFFNCHILQCPQNSSFSLMVNDSRFDYYSIYGRPVVLQNYTCIPEVGLFVLYTTPTSYLNASVACSNSTEFFGSLAHPVSESRTKALVQLLLKHDDNESSQGDIIPQNGKSGIFLAYIGLHWNRTRALNAQDFRNEQNESLHCYLYRAWAVDHPRQRDFLANASCVALTPQATWQSVSCDHPLPYICEIFTASNGQRGSELDTGSNAMTECHNYSLS